MLAGANPDLRKRKKGATMGKLFNLKKWVTVVDAARHLSIVFDEEVTEADIYRFALERRITLSVDFPNGAYARKGRKVPIAQANLTELPPVKGDGKAVFAAIGEYLPETGEIIQFDENVIVIHGVWDLCMMHNDRFDIEWRYYQEISNIERNGVSFEGVILRIGDTYSNLQEEFPRLSDEAFSKQSETILASLERHITNDRVSDIEAEKLIAEHQRKRKAIRDNNEPGFFPAGGLPSDSILVVRTEVLQQFEQSINGEPIFAEQSMAATDRACVSNKLARMNQAAVKFWGNTDRNDRGTHPENAMVAAWLIKQGFSPTLADKAATIIRPEWAPLGRKPEE